MWPQFSHYLSTLIFLCVSLGELVLIYLQLYIYIQVDSQILYFILFCKYIVLLDNPYWMIWSSTVHSLWRRHSIVSIVLWLHSSIVHLMGLGSALHYITLHTTKGLCARVLTPFSYLACVYMGLLREKDGEAQCAWCVMQGRHRTWIPCSRSLSTVVNTVPDGGLWCTFMPVCVFGVGG